MPPSVVSLTSASSFLALIDDPKPKLQAAGINKLLNIVDQFWAEISESLEKLEELSEDEEFDQKELASLLVSKVYYHLGEFSDSMSFALAAGKKFDVDSEQEFEVTLVGKFIDEYIKKRIEKTTSSEAESVVIDVRLEDIVMRMFDRCFKDGKFRQALGIALESRRLDKIEESISQSGDVKNMLHYCFTCCQELVDSRDFRHSVLAILVKLYKELSVPDYVNVCQCLILLNDPKAVAEILDSLCMDANDEDRILLAYQLAFDLYEDSTQQFLENIRKNLPVVGVPAQDSETTEKEDAMEIETSDKKLENPVEKLHTILSGTTSIGIYLEFLHRNCASDLLILKNIKESTDIRNSSTHTATVFSDAIMHAGTTRDKFLRDNLEWLAKATNWAKFSATAGLGVIHKGHLKEALQLLGPYLPQGVAGVSPFSEGGALYALGIIHANHGEPIVKYLLDGLHNAGANEVVQHGACLGLGISAMATGDEVSCEEMKNILFTDNAVAGEAAAMGMGMVMCGTADQKTLEEMLAYAHDTQHEKIIRGLAIGISLVMYGREEEADTLIEQLTLDKDPILRYGAMYTIGMAYCGTGNNGAVKRLLHIAVSDVSDDVRRAAVTNLGFLLFNNPEQCPKLVSLLAESYNPHVRYGSTLALGISCAGTASPDAIKLLEPLTTDSVDYVKQGALIALSMILVQHNASQVPKVDTIRKLFASKIGDKHEQTPSKFGAILATGIIDAGGRNVTISLKSASGHPNMSGIVGLAIFTQFWYWFPLIHFISLSFSPTSAIGLNSNLKMPMFSFKSNSKPSVFAYPPETKPPVEKKATRVETAQLSYSKKKKPTEDEAMEVEENLTKPEETNETLKKEEEELEAKLKETEPEFDILQNPARVTVAQRRHISFDVDERYQPILPDSLGIIVLKDKKPDEEIKLVVTTTESKGGAMDIADEPDPPDAFEWNEDLLL